MIWAISKAKWLISLNRKPKNQKKLIISGGSTPIKALGEILTKEKGLQMGRETSNLRTEVNIGL